MPLSNRQAISKVIYELLQAENMIATEIQQLEAILAKATCSEEACSNPGTFAVVPLPFQPPSGHVNEVQTRFCSVHMEQYVSQNGVSSRYTFFPIATTFPGPAIPTISTNPNNNLPSSTTTAEDDFFDLGTNQHFDDTAILDTIF